MCFCVCVSFNQQQLRNIILNMVLYSIGDIAWLTISVLYMCVFVICFSFTLNFSFTFEKKNYWFAFKTQTDPFAGPTPPLRLTALLLTTVYLYHVSP